MAIGKVERRRDPAAASLRCVRCVRSRRGSSTRATGRRRSRSTSAARSNRRRSRRVDAHAAGGRRAVDDDERVGTVRPVHRHGDAGRRLVVRVRVDVALDVVDELRRLARFGLAHLRVVEVRARFDVHRGELRRELAEHEVRAAPLDEAERGRVPEQRGTADPDQHFVAVGQREQVAYARADAARRPTSRPSRRWLVPRKPGAASASAATASLRTFDGPDPKRPSRGPERAGKFDRGVGHRATLVAGLRQTRGPRRNRPRKHDDAGRRGRAPRSCR